MAGARKEESVNSAHAPMARGRTRWRRFALVTVPAVVLAGGIVLGMADGAVGQPGGFGQQADSVTINGLHQVAWSTSAGTFNLNGLDLHVSLTGEQCFP